MLQHLNLLHIATLLLTFTSATELTSEEKGKNIKLQSFSINSPESINAIFKSGGFFFNITSYVQDETSASSSKTSVAEALDIVSLISLTDLEDGIGRRTELSLVLSQLVIPKKYLHQRRIPDMEERIVNAAKDMLKASQKLTVSTVLSLPDLVNLYDVMIEYLVPVLNVQHKFNQGRAAFIYHDSIARTALRLAQGASPKTACPAHQAYDFQGLFACQQEYSLHAKKVLSSQLFNCRDIECIKKVQSYLAHLLHKDAGILDMEEATELVEDVLGLGVGNNSKLAEDIARLIACGNISCFEPGCNSWIYTDGWFIDGADWGCCGDYPGCCFLATEVCLVHDAICTCCSFPSFCLDPFCKPDAWCSKFTTTKAPLFS